MAVPRTNTRLIRASFLRPPPIASIATDLQQVVICQHQWEGGQHGVRERRKGARLPVGRGVREHRGGVSGTQSQSRQVLKCQVACLPSCSASARRYAASRLATLVVAIIVVGMYLAIAAHQT